MNKMVAVLYNFRSVYNTAACFRTADGAGVKKLYLVGTTPAPMDRFGEKRADFAKVALGAEESVKYEKVEDVFELIRGLKKKGFLVAAVEQDKRAEDLFKFRSELDSRLRGNDMGRGELDPSFRWDDKGGRELDPSLRGNDMRGGELDPSLRWDDRKGVALIFGNEVEGIPEEILEKCDKILEIPMRGKKESLNVSVAFGIATYILTRFPLSASARTSFTRLAEAPAKRAGTRPTELFGQATEEK